MINLVLYIIMVLNLASLHRNSVSEMFGGVCRFKHQKVCFRKPKFLFHSEEHIATSVNQVRHGALINERWLGVFSFHSSFASLVFRMRIFKHCTSWSTRIWNLRTLCAFHYHKSSNWQSSSAEWSALMLFQALRLERSIPYSRLLTRNPNDLTLRWMTTYRSAHRWRSYLLQVVQNMSDISSTLGSDLLYIVVFSIQELTMSRIF